MKIIKGKQKLKAKLQQKWHAPPPPWEAPSANLVWNIHNMPAAQISMLGKIVGLSTAPVAACATFSVCLKFALDAIHRGEAKAVVIGAAETYPTPLILGAFSQARVAASGSDISIPLTGLKGTHVSGGAVIWIVGDYDYMVQQGFKPLGMEPVAVGCSSDADHIITPSQVGPKLAIQQALKQSAIEPKDVASWDLHATGTPGDFTEISNLKDIFSPSLHLTARKGTFGHGLGVCAGWELTAQYLCYERGCILPTTLRPETLHPTIKALHSNFVFDQHCALPQGHYVGKLSMGVGGINACVISKRLSHS